MRSFAILICSAALLGTGPIARAQAAPSKAVPLQLHAPASLVKPAPFLPGAFEGWVISGTPKILTTTSEADSTNASALREYDFAHGELATYERDGETLTIRAMRFSDTSGAYGAYTFYRQNGWPKVDIGSGAASDHNRVLFWVGDTVVDASFSRVGPMSAGELRELARQLPHPIGNKAIAPPILFSLPQASLSKQTTHYALGPNGYAGSGGVLSPGLVGFDEDAEAVTANYALQSGVATLTLIEYPTPQIAEAKESTIRAYIKAGSKAQPPWPKPLLDSDQASLEVLRSGPLVALVSGDAIPDESHRLLETVHYAADLTSIPQPVESEVAKTSKLLIGIVQLVLIGSFAAILLGFFLGGGRALYRIARGKPASSVYETEFIRLNLPR
jgi:hypothetical protein